MFAHRYLIGYITESKYGSQITGSSVISRSKPILTSKDVEKTEQELKKDLRVENVFLISFSKLEGIE